MNNKSIYRQFKSQDRAKKKFTIGGGVVILLVAISPYLFYLYEGFPNDFFWKTFLFEHTLEHYTWYQFAWFLSGKLIPLYLLFIWFFTCKHWWHWIILIPITMYLFQTWAIVNQTRNADEVELLYMLPVMLVVIPAVYLIRAKVFNKMRGDNLKEFEEELKQKRTIWGELREFFR